MFSEMFSSGHPSTDNIHKFMNAIYVDRPKDVTLFNINYRTHADRATVKGIRIGPSLRCQKNVVLVSGLPLQDPSVIGVNLYVAAALSRSPLGRDVSVIPLAHPREYEQRWRRAERASSSSLFSSILPGPAPRSPGSAPSLIRDEPASNVATENICFELQETCKPIEAYVTRQNKYYVNIEVDMTAHGSSMQHKSNSLTALTSRGRCRTFFADPSLLAPEDRPLPGHIHGKDSLLAPFTQAPSLVLELRSGQSLTDDQIAARGEEVIGMIKELLE